MKGLKNRWWYKSMLIAMDFDGVVVDGVDECMLIAWNVLHDRPLGDFNQDVLQKIPRQMASRFKKLRNFVRHDGHFIASFSELGNEVMNNDEFSAIYESFSPKEKDIFRDKFIQYRKQARNTYPIFWAKLHRPLLDISKLFSTSHDIYIVSGKDEDSISFILREHGLNVPTEKIFGRMTDKNETLTSLKLIAAAKNEEMLFIDDNIQNVIDALEHGIQSFWANWGYNIPEHKVMAHKNGINVLSTVDLLELVKRPS
ncbi:MULTISPECIES: HAD family hydrolase [unclassified Brenneria]|uniref:HAD family hydrolase n=1 Tax=Enterobacterales TaxID=91347 RepID=UPI002EB43A1D|nr:hypothetical protein [Brenneria sp. HEZEL_4_2_4]